MSEKLGHPYLDGELPDDSIIETDQDSYTDRFEECRPAILEIVDESKRLSPIGILWTIEHLLDCIGDTSTGCWPEEEIAELDPAGEQRAFYEKHADELIELKQRLNAMLGICPDCGGVQKPLDLGGWVRSETGEVVRVIGSTHNQVQAEAQIAGGTRTVDRQYDRKWFTEHFVPAEGVELLGGAFQ